MSLTTLSDPPRLEPARKTCKQHEYGIRSRFHCWLNLYNKHNVGISGTTQLIDLAQKFHHKQQVLEQYAGASETYKEVRHWPQLLTWTGQHMKYVKNTRSPYLWHFSMPRSHACLSFSKSVFLHCTNWIGNMLSTWSFQYHTISLLSRVILPWLQTACFNTWVVGDLVPFFSRAF